MFHPHNGYRVDLGFIAAVAAVLHVDPEELLPVVDLTDQEREHIFVPTPERLSA